MQRIDKTPLQLRMAELRNTDASLSKQAEDALPVLNKISNPDTLLSDLKRHLSRLTIDNIWSEIPDEVPNNLYQIALACYKINQRLGNAEQNQAFVERVSSCNWIMNNFLDLQTTINQSALNNREKATLIQTIATAMQRMTKLPILAKDLLSDATKAVQSEQPDQDLNKNALITNIKSLQRKFLRLLSMINNSMPSQQDQPGYIQSFWSFFTGQSDTADLNNSAIFKEDAANTLGNSMLAESLGGVFMLHDETTEEKSTDEIASLQNSLIGSNESHALEDSTLFMEAAEKANSEIQKLINSSVLDEDHDFSSESANEVAQAPSIAPAKKQNQIKDEKNPLIGLLKNTNAYLTKRAKETQSFPHNLFGYGADDYHARRDHWRNTLELLNAIAKPENKSTKLVALLEAQLNQGILQFNKGRGQYAQCLAGIQAKLQSFDRDEFTIMFKGAANYIERSHKAYSELDKLRQPVSDFAACSIFKPVPDQVKQNIKNTLDTYADVVKLDKPIQHGGYRWDSRKEFLSRDEAKKTEYNNVTSRKLV